MTLFLCWVVFPLELGLLSLGCGLLIQSLSARRLPGALITPVGLATVIVVGDFATASSATARLGTPLVVGLAIGGFGLSIPPRRRSASPRALAHALWQRVDPWAAVTVAGVYAAYAAPIVLSGQATLAGYITLDDSATWLALTDHVMQHGRSLAGLAPSTYQQVLKDYLSSGYPLGSFIPLGVGGQLSGEDVAWLFQPTVAVYAAILALSIYSLGRDLVRRSGLRALVAFLAAQPALLFQYAFWTGIKEMAAAMLLTLIVAVSAPTIDRWNSWRGALPISVAVAAFLAVLSVAGGFWLVIPAVAAIVVLLRRQRTVLAGAAVRVVGLVAALSVPSLALAYTFVQSASGNAGALNDTGGLLGSIHLGNLGHPLNDLQILGIWPATDFRAAVHNPALTHILFAVLGLAIVSALYFATRRRAWTVPIYLAAGAGGFGLLLLLGALGLSSPWLDAKAMATGSPAVLTAGFAGVAMAFESGRRTEAVLAGFAIAAGVVWSNALTFGNVWLAPRAQLSELETIGKRFAGDGPTLITEYQPFGARHFLRGLDPEAAGERRTRVIALRTGGSVALGGTADLDRFALGAVLVYRTLVLRTSPTESRPPSDYRLVWSGRWYDVWQRSPAARRIIEHLSLGTGIEPAAVPACSTILGAAAEARRDNDVLATVLRPTPPVVVDLSRSDHPNGWSVAGESLVAGAPGVALEKLRLARAGAYGFWIGGSFRRVLEVSVDGRRVGSVSDQLNNTGEWTPLGAVRLRQGVHRVSLRYGGSALAPGSGGFPFAMGPLILSSGTAEPPVRYVDPSRARSLCGQRLDWLEVVS